MSEVTPATVTGEAPVVDGTEAADNPDTVIRFRDLTKTYYLGDVRVPALQGVSLEIKRGELVAIMGPSGSGKSTLMNIIGCLDQPTSGEYELDGATIGQLEDDELAEIRNKKIGFVFQQFNLLARSSALEQVELPLVYAGVPERRARAQASLEDVGLGDRVHFKPTELSGGQQQRVAIARALVNRPAILLADEPTGALDTTTAGEIMAVLQRLNREQNLTVILVTHEKEIADYTRRIVHIRDGVISDDEVVQRQRLAETLPVARSEVEPAD